RQRTGYILFPYTTLFRSGGKYGSVDAEGVSFTEREYELAVSLGKRVMAFLHGDPDQIPAGKSEMQEEARARLEAFRSRVETAKQDRKSTRLNSSHDQISY